ncbi:MAG TPA: glutamyl-tRNA reductase [Dermatophilaceae bacterium]|nr:glutamyl-tRNA reductase [Dermatophilaceae bacterium]
MDRLLMVGLTHRRTPVGLLERVTVPREERARVLGALAAAGCAEAVVLSTCSRTEVYATAPPLGPHALLTVLTERAGLSVPSSVVEVRTGQAVVEHLFRVTAGLESRIVGDVEVQGQVQQAFRAAHAAGGTGPVLGRLFPAALRCAREVRARSPLGARGPSLARRAVDMGLESLSAALRPATGPVEDAVVLIVGSGHMATTAVEHLRSLGRRPRVAARDLGRAVQLAGAGFGCALADLAGAVAAADLLICATSADHYLVTQADVRSAMVSRQRPLTVVDLSVPRNVDASVAAVPDVRLIDLESMNDDATGDPAVAAALAAGSAIVTADTKKYAEAEAARQVGPLIAAIRHRVEQTCLATLAEAAAPGAPGEAATRAATSTPGMLLHRATLAARAAAAAGDVAALRRLYDVFEVHGVSGAVIPVDECRRRDHVEALCEMLVADRPGRAATRVPPAAGPVPV